MKKKSNINISMSYALTSLALVTMLTTGAILMSSKVAADTSVVDTTTITVPTACSMSGTGMTSHTATLQPGTYSAASGSEYENGIGTTTLTTFCNDYNGFSIYAIGYTGDSYGDNTLVGTTTGLTIATKAYESTDTTSNWSMKVNKVDNATAYNPSYMSIDNSYGSWHAVPSEYTRVAHFKATTDNTSSATDTTLGGKVTTTYAAFVSSTQAADTYTGQVKYVMVHPYSSANPDPYKPVVPIAMQNLNSSLCTTTEPTTVVDSRDGESYLVQRLADGNCWMLENLNLAGGTTLSSADTDMPDGYTLPTANNFQSDNKLPASATAGFYDGTIAYVYNSGNKENCGASGQDTPCYSYYSWTAATLGSGLSISTDNTDAPYSICPKGWKLPTSRTTDVSNWQTASDFYALAHQYGLDSTSSLVEIDDGFYAQAGPGTTPNFLLAGYYNSGSLYAGGSGGFYWSSTSYSSSDGKARYLNFYSSYVQLSDARSRNNGYSVRCLLRES